MSDFELGIRGTIKQTFDGALLKGCYFHFCKAIWGKIKKYNLFKKELRINTLILAFIIKSYPFIKENNREKYCEKIEEYCKNLKGNYIKLYNYFSKYWKTNKLFNFTYLNDNRILKRTNNVVENFHSKLNRYISHFHPKSSYLVNELKKLTKEYYDSYIIKLSKRNEEEININYIAKDIINFIKKFVDVHKVNFDIDNLNQFIKLDGESFYELNLLILNSITDCKDDAIDNLKILFIKNHIIENMEDKNNENGTNNHLDELDEEYDNLCNDSNIFKYNDKAENKNIIIDGFKKLSSYEQYLLDGDELILEKSNKFKNKRKVKSIEKNMLDDLEYIEQENIDN